MLVSPAAVANRYQTSAHRPTHAFQRSGLDHHAEKVLPRAHLTDNCSAVVGCASSACDSDRTCMHLKTMTTKVSFWEIVAFKGSVVPCYLSLIYFVATARISRHVTTLLQPSIMVHPAERAAFSHSARGHKLRLRTPAPSKGK